MKKENEILEALKRGDTINKVIKDLKTCQKSIRKVIDKHPDLFSDSYKKGRPKGVDNKGRYSFRVPKPMADKIDAEIEKEKSTPSKFFNGLLEKYSLIEEWGCGE